MTRSIRTRTSAALSAAVLTVLTLAACSDDTTEDAEPTMEETTAQEETTMAEEEMDEETESESPDEMETVDGPFGPGCAAYVEANPSGPASVGGMAEGNVVDAVIANPELQTLKAAVAGELNPDVNLVDTLAGGEFTVLAPINDAFAALPEEDLNAVVSDADTLTSVLTYHVIPGRLGPDEIVGEHETVNGATVTIEGSGDDLQFDGAGLVCGNVDTTNATVYMIDSVLLPSATRPGFLSRRSPTGTGTHSRACMNCQAGCSSLRSFALSETGTLPKRCSTSASPTSGLLRRALTPHAVQEPAGWSRWPGVERSTA